MLCPLHAFYDLNSILRTGTWHLERFKECVGVPVVVQWLMNPTRNHEVVGSIPGLAQWVEDSALP